MDVCDSNHLVFPNFTDPADVVTVLLPDTFRKKSLQEGAKNYN